MLPAGLIDFVNDFLPEELIDEVNRSAASMERAGKIAAQAAALRRFNRFYFARMRILREAMTGPGYRASQLRILRMLGEVADGTVAVRIAADLRMDPAHVSRILSWLRALGYLTEEPMPGDRRTKIIRLSPLGRRSYESLDREAASTAYFMLQLLPAEERDRLFQALAVVENVLRSIPL